jgi:MoxR-like ATPase
VFATQNPVEFEGTYPLPEAQRDRFMVKIDIGYPASADEERMLESYAAGRRLHDEVVSALEPALSGDELLAARHKTRHGVRVDANVRQYILQLVSRSRQDESVQIAPGPRASLALMETARALALLRGRDFTTPDDAKEMAPAVLRHRVTLTPEAEMEGMALEDVLRRVFEQVEVPR